MNNYVEEFFARFASAGITPGLERVRALLSKLNDPQKELRFIHIAGTNGKGSAGCFCNAILSAVGLKTGWFSTPHLIRRSESIRVTDGLAGLRKLNTDETTGEITEKQMLRYFSEIEAAVSVLKAEGLDYPSEFELMTAIAFLHFQRENCEVVILETGMGGLEDATNIIDNPVICLITALGLDHSAWLGSDILNIARHKAGIIKSNSSVWLYDPTDAIGEGDEADNVKAYVTDVCAEQSADLNIVSAKDIMIEESSLDGHVFCQYINQIFENTDKRRVVEKFRINLAGLYQPQLAALSIGACLEFLRFDGKTNDLQYDVIIDIFRQGLLLARWPGRFELCQLQSETSGPILLDGAHNHQGCLALELSLSAYLKNREIIFVTGILADKDAEVMLSSVFLEGSYRCGPIICTEPVNSRAMKAYDLANSLAKLTGRRLMRLPIRPDNSYNNSGLVFYEDDPIRATDYAVCLNNDPAKALCVFGSLYLAGAVRRQLISNINE